MNTKEVKDLIKFISDSKLAEVNLETDQIKLSIKRFKDTEQTGPIPHDKNPYYNQLSIKSLPKPLSSKTTQSQDFTTYTESKYLSIKSPLIGTFYICPTPDSPPFVKIGDTIVKGQKICVIEAMKLFNEIESEYDGTIVDILVENASPVEYGQDLFLISSS